MVDDITFAKYYSAIMPLLLNVVRNADRTEHHRLRTKAMECGGLVGRVFNNPFIPFLTLSEAIAVGRDVIPGLSLSYRPYTVYVYPVLPYLFGADEYNGEFRGP
jgi:hypothetical protein